MNRVPQPPDAVADTVRFEANRWNRGSSVARRTCARLTAFGTRRRATTFARIAILALVVIRAAVLHAQAFIDPGFESYAVNPGGFIQPASGAWLFSNDAGVVEPPAPNSSTGPGNTWSATFAAVEGQQYASTYAGADNIRQSVAFSAAGDYRLSVYAAAPNGSITIPTVGTFPLGSGEFTFTLANVAIGSLHTVPGGSGWSLFTTDLTIAAPGNFQLGVRNTQPTPYFLNYDAFTIQPVPEPSAMALGLLGALVLALVGRLRTNCFGRQPERSGGGPS